MVIFEPMDGPTAPKTGFSQIVARQVSIPNMVTLKVKWAIYQMSKKFGLVHEIS